MKQTETNINEKPMPKNVQSHNARIKAFCDNYSLSPEEAKSAIDLMDKQLCYGYTDEIILRAERNGLQVSPQTVRFVKRGQTKNITIFNYLIDFATVIKESKVRVKGSIQKNMKK